MALFKVKPQFRRRGGIKYVGTATALSKARESLAATSIGDYALFGSGRYVGPYGYLGSGVVDAYNTSLVQTYPQTMYAKGFLAATSVGDYAIFGGGDDYYSGMAIYNTSLTKSNKSLYVGRQLLAAASAGNYAIFGGGYSSNGASDDVDLYNTSLTHSTPTMPLSRPRYRLAAASVGDYVLFGGGALTDVVDAYDARSTLRTTATTLSQARYDLAAASVGNYALFGGGYGNGNNSYDSRRDTVDAYNTSLTRSILTPLSLGRYKLAATSVGDYAIFGGGCGLGINNTVDIYDTSLTRMSDMELSQTRYDLAAASVGNYALFGGGVGGYNNSDDYDTVDVFQVA